MEIEKNYQRHPRFLLGDCHGAFRCRFCGRLRGCADYGIQGSAHPRRRSVRDRVPDDGDSSHG